MSEPTERIVAALDRHGCAPRRSGNGWAARCPAHDDRKASLSVAAGDNGGVVLHCHAGCSAESVVRNLGLTMADLIPDRPYQPVGNNGESTSNGQVFRDAQAA